ncbi:MAG TPA: iron chelate uptake ABC transporter family permease subunit, partial [Mycobacterium sp.]|nr:iron chelate uptake ABC transporter family permease subunit [Mycobacterium sp.]
MTALVARATPAAGRRPGRVATVLGVLLISVVVLTLVGVAVGPVRIPLADTVRILLGAESADPRWQVVVTAMRLPRVLTAIAAGAALAVAGLQMQTLFRNILADPYVLGVSSGASLGVALVAIGSGSATAGFTAGLGGGRTAVVLAAAVGAGLVLALVLVLSRWVRSAATLLLIGVM